MRIKTLYTTLNEYSYLRLALVSTAESATKKLRNNGIPKI